MKIFIAGTYIKQFALENALPKYLLESFFYITDWQIKILPQLDMFLLDSGAFTFMSSVKNCDFEEYLTQYIHFINKHDIKYFFELDIDSIVGYEKVKEYRKRLERETGKNCIPVWHKSRGKEEFLRLCDKYDYVAIGGIVTKEITNKEYPYFTWFINEAHKRGAKIHGLGFTQTSLLDKYHFDSVDSTSWISGGKYGHIYYIENGVVKHKEPPKGKRAMNYRVVDCYNLSVWLKYQKYAEQYL